MLLVAYAFLFVISIFFCTKKTTFRLSFSQINFFNITKLLFIGILAVLHFDLSLMCLLIIKWHLCRLFKIYWNYL